jgi:copper chaperone CopZ
MKTETIKILNLSCNGCVNSISKALKKINEVSEVDVSLENHEVTVRGTELLDRDNILNSLKELGSPEANEENGMLTKLKSIQSCMIGKITQ